MGALGNKCGCKCSCCKCACCRSTPEGLDLLAPDEDEIDFCTYKSKSDKFLSPLEETNNCLNYMTLPDYANLLDNFTLENATLSFEGIPKTKYSYKDEFLVYELFPESFQSFIQNKVIKDNNVVNSLDDDEDKKQIFIEYTQELYKALQLKLNKGINRLNIYKKDVLPLGMLYTQSTNVGKMRLFFDLFKNENEEFCKSEELNEYLLSSFLLASYCNLSAKNKIAKSKKSIGEVNLNELTEYIKTSEFKDCQALVQYFNDNFFANKSSYNWEEFKSKFGGKDTKDNFAWIFSAQGTRQKMEENNN